jgi:hypothetical protein
MSLPDRRPATIGQPIYQPTPINQPVETYRPGPIVFVPDPYDPNRSVAIPAQYAQAPAVYQPRDLTPQPLLDPVAQRMLGAGVGGGALAAGVGWGASEAVGAIAGIGTGTMLWLACFVVAVRTLPGLVARRPRIHNETHVHHENRWLGHSTTNIQQR